VFDSDRHEHIVIFPQFACGRNALGGAKTLRMLTTDVQITARRAHANPASMRGVLPDVIDYRPLDGTPAPRAPIALACQRIHRSKAVKNFVELVETTGKL
jgi:hypothetical protein